MEKPNPQRTKTYLVNHARLEHYTYNDLELVAKNVFSDLRLVAKNL